MKRRSFLALMGTAPLAAKATADAEIGRQMGLNAGYGAGNSLGGYGMPIGAGTVATNAVSYEQRVSGAVKYMEVFGIPEAIERELRENNQWVGALDPDIASKKSWSMAVKVMTQRQRNYERSVERLKGYGWQVRGREAVKKVLGFDWPW